MSYIRKRLFLPPEKGKKEPLKLTKRENLHKSGLYDTPAPQAAGTQFHPLGSAADLGAHGDQVRSELANRFIVRMTYIVPEHAFFSTNFTLS